MVDVEVLLEADRVQDLKTDVEPLCDVSEPLAPEWHQRDFS